MSRRSQRTQRRAMHLVLASSIALGLLSGCPVTDDYFINPEAGGPPPAASGGTAGDLGTGGTGGSSETGGTGVGATGGSDESGGTAGSGAATVSGGSAGSAGSADSGSGGQSGEPATAGSAGSAGSEPGCPAACNAPRSCTDGCASGWVLTSAPPGGFSPREQAASTSIDTRLFIWGGLNESGTALNSGAIYDPRGDSWMMIAIDADTPSPRSRATAVWTGSVVVVFGGFDTPDHSALSDGAIYDPVEDAWSPLPDSPRPRVAPFGAFVDDRVVSFGGYDDQGRPLQGIDLYDPDQDSWDTGSSFNDPDPVADAATAGGTLTFWTYGGRAGMNQASAETRYYSMSNDRWSSEDSRSPGRWGSFAALIDTTFFVWGGRDVDDVFSNGAGYLLTGSRWAGMNGAGAPSARYAADRETGWTFVATSDTRDPRVLVIGGLSGPTEYLMDGGLYDPGLDEWELIPPWPSSASHALGAAGWAAGELVLWGGRDGTSLTNVGVRYLPPE